MMTIKEYAGTYRIAYQTACSRVRRHREELGEHISVQNGTQYLDDIAIELLNQCHRVAPVTVYDTSTVEEVQELKNQTAQDRQKIEQAQAELIEAQRSIVSLQTEVKDITVAQTQSEYELKSYRCRLQNAEHDLENVRQELSTARQELADARTQRDGAMNQFAIVDDENRRLKDALDKYSKTIFGLYKREK